MIICRGTNETNGRTNIYLIIQGLAVWFSRKSNLKNFVNLSHNIPDWNKVLKQEQVRIKKITCFSRKSNLEKNGKSQA